MSINRAWYELPLPRAGLDSLTFAVAHWLLSPGRSEMARLRGYLRLKAWRRCRTNRERLRMLGFALKLPARAARESVRAIGQHGEVARREGVGNRRQFCELFWLWLRHGIHSEPYYAFRLFRPGRLRLAPLFLQDDEDDDLYRLLSLHDAAEDMERLLDKFGLEQSLRARGHRTVRTVAAFDEGACTFSELFDQRLPQCDLFSKPRDAVQGFRAQLWRCQNGSWCSGSMTLSQEELLSYLASESRARPMLLQEALHSHPALAVLSPGAVSTIRLLTLRDSDDEVRPILAVIKMPVGRSHTDHFRKGAVGARVDLETGKLCAAMISTPVGYVEPITRHPDSGREIVGFELPQWAEARALAIAAHESLPKITCVGWDIAITEDGPAIIEGNDNPGHRSSQLPTGVPIGSTPIVSNLCARIDAVYLQNGARRSAHEVAESHVG